MTKIYVILWHYYIESTFYEPLYVSLDKEDAIQYFNTLGLSGYGAEKQLREYWDRSEEYTLLDVK